MTTQNAPYKSKGFMGWLGRQVAHVRHAIAHDVTAEPKVVYRAMEVQLQPHPTHPNVTLRRTTIDEVIVPGSKCLNHTPQAPSHER